MRLNPAIGRISTIVLALVLVAMTRPAEGLTFFEQRDLFVEPLMPALRPDETQLVMDLSGQWECVVDSDDPPIPVWVPCSFVDAPEELTLRRTFALADTLRKWNFQLVVPEAHYSVQVWINGRMISSFSGNHLGFSCDLARDVLRFGAANELALRISSDLSPRASLPLRPQVGDSRNYGGLFSGVYLRGLPAWSIEDARVLTKKIEPASDVAADVIVRIARYAASLPTGDSLSDRAVYLAVSLQDSSGTILAEARRDLEDHNSPETFQVTVPLAGFKTRIWSPSSPVLNSLTTMLIAGGDTLHRRVESIGFKHVEIRSGDIYLNGSRLALQGMDYVPEHPRGGRAVAASHLRADVLAMKHLGVNVLRVPGSAPPPELVNLCDEHGLLLLVEAGLDRVPAPFLQGSDQRQLCERTFSKLTSEYGRHVSVLAWGVGSRLDWKDPITQQFGDWLYSYVKGLDDRPCYTESSDLSASGRADIVLWPMTAGKTGEVVLPSDPDRPVLVSRLGRPLSPGDPTQRDLSAGLVNQADYLIREIGRINQSQSVDGYVIHAFADYHGESPMLSQPNYSEPRLYGYGVVAHNRSERVVYFKLRDLVQTGQVSPPISSPVTQGSPLAFPVVGLAFLLIASVEMRRNNVFRQNLKRVFLHPHGFHMDLRYRRFLHTAQPLLLWLIESVTLALLTVSLMYALRNSAAFDYYLTLFLPSAEWKSSVINLIWNPMYAVIFFTALFLGLILLLTIATRIVSIPFRERVDFWQAINYVIRSLAALLFLLPVGVILFRTLETPQFFTPSIVVVGIGLAWCVQRLLSAMRIGYGTTAWRVYLAAFVLLGLFVGGALLLHDRSFGTFAYLEFYDRVFRGL